MENFRKGYNGVLNNRPYIVLQHGMYGNGNEHIRKIQFCDGNKEEETVHKSMLTITKN